MSADAKREEPKKRKTWSLNWIWLIWPLAFLPTALSYFGADYFALIDVRFDDKEHLEWKVPIKVSWPNAVAISEGGELIFVDGGADLYKIQTDGSKKKLHDTKQGQIIEFSPHGVFLTPNNKIVVVTSDFRPMQKNSRADGVPIPTIFTTMDYDGSIIAEFILADNHQTIDVDKQAEIIYAMNWDFELSALDVNGTLLWERVLDSHPNVDNRRWETYWIHGQENGGVLAVSKGGALISLSSTGDILWENSEHVIRGRDIAIAPDGTIVAGVDLRGLVAINPDGVTKWFNPKAISWNDSSGSIAISTDGIILVDNYTSFLVAFDPDGNELWHKKLGSTVVQTAASNANSFFVATESNGLYCFDSNGTELWANPGIDYVFGDIVINPNGLIHFATYNRLYALNP